nr:uncharacterized protein LOC111424331 [Onthophagus taurus]
MGLFNIFAFIFVIATTQAYNFEDSIYNHILINELDQLQWDSNKLFDPRSKRETDSKCKSDLFRSCCEEDYFRELYEEDKAYKKECYRELKGKDLEDSLIDLLKCNKNEEIKNDIGCLAECVARKRGLIDDEGNLKEAEAKKSFEEKCAKIEWFAPKANEIFAKCYSASVEAGKASREKGQCNLASIKYGHCLWKSIQASCPADRVTDEAKCKKIRENIDSLEEFTS